MISGVDAQNTASLALHARFGWLREHPDAKRLPIVRAEGGIPFARERAEHRGMPESAVATGCIDFSLPVEHERRGGVIAQVVSVTPRPVATAVDTINTSPFGVICAAAQAMRV